MQLTKQQDPLDGTTRGYLQISRQNQQLLLYLFITAVIILSWIFGIFELSFLWTFGLITITFVVWKAKVIRLTEEHIRHEEAIVHRKRALRGHCETSEWLNFLINRWWVFSSGSIEDLVKKHLNPLLLNMKPKFIESIVLKSFTLGSSTPCIKYLKVFEGNVAGHEGSMQASWQNIVQPPPGLPQLGRYLVVLEGQINLQCDEFKMVFSARLGGKWMGLTVDVVVEKMHIDGTMQLTLNMNSDAAFPHVSHAILSFQERPEVWFSVRVLKALQMMEVPVLKTWIHSLVMDALTHALVDPAKLEMQVASTGPGTLLPAKNKSRKLAEGVLTISVSGESKGGVFTDDVRYCSLILGEQKEHTKHTRGSQKWQDICSFLVHDLKQEKLLVKSKGKRMFTTYTIADFELVLANYPFEHQSCQEEHLEKKVSKWESGGTFELDIKMEYSPLPQLNLNNAELEEEMPAVQEVAGVMYVCVHSARNLLALDRTGTSDPYCIVFNNGHKVKTTHYVCSTRNPDWDTSMEFLVGDFTKTVLSFIVYDWDGQDASESDFLGSAFCVLSPEEPCVVQRSLVLSYLMNVGTMEAKLGSITISAIFRPVSAVARAELKRINSGHTDVQDKNRNILSKMVSEAGYDYDVPAGMHIKELKKAPAVSPGVGDMLLGHGILELNIIRGIDLVAKDSNGFSDPFFEVKVGNERKFTSSIKRKTLNPVWDEWVTLQMPGPGEVLEIVVWDKDPFFKKDFLGCLSFDSEELKRHSSDKESHLYPLQRIASGQIELRLQVMTEDICDHGHSRAWPVTDSAPVSDSTTPCRSEPGQSPNPDVLPTLQNYFPYTNRCADCVLQTKVNGLETFPEESTVKATLERTGSFKLERTQSFNIGSSFRNRFRNLSGQKSVPGTLSRTPSGQIGNHFYNVTGKLLKVKGLLGTEGKIYCKIRLDNRDSYHRSKRISQGHVLAKTSVLESSREVSFSLAFDVDRKVGVLQEAQLVFDIKHSKRSHIVTKGFQLQDIFLGATDITKWLNLNQTIQIEISMTRR